MTSPIDASDDDARLIEIATETARLAAEAASIIARRSSRPAAPFRLSAADLVDSARAEKLTGVSRSTIIREARRNSALGWKLPGGSWRFVRRELIARFNSPSDEIAEIADFADAQSLFEMTNHD